MTNREEKPEAKECPRCHGIGCGLCMGKPEQDSVEVEISVRETALKILNGLDEIHETEEGAYSKEQSEERLYFVEKIIKTERRKTEELQKQLDMARDFPHSFIVHHAGEKLMKINAALEEKVRALQSKNKALVEALKRFGTHLEDCKMNKFCYNSDRVCTCGLEQALKDGEANTTNSPE